MDMSDTGPPPKASSEFEARLDQADMSVAAFDQDKPGPLQILRGFLHTNPTAIPAFVLALRDRKSTRLNSSHRH